MAIVDYTRLRWFIGRNSERPDKPEGLGEAWLSYDTGARYYATLTETGLDWATIPAGGGESNTASNVGTGAGVFKQKVGVNLELRSIKAGSTKLSVSQDTNEVSVDLGTVNFADLNTKTHTHADAANGGQIGTGGIADNAVSLAKLAHGTAGKVIGFDGIGAPSELSITPSTIIYRALLEEQKTTGTDAGTFSSGAMRTRAVNTVVSDINHIVSLRKLAFTSGSEEPTDGVTLVGANSGATATLFEAQLTGGTWTGGDAVGIFWLLNDQSGTFVAENINISGGTSNIATCSANSVVDGQWRLKAGIYPLVEIIFPAFDCGFHQGQLYNITDAEENGTGSSQNASSADQVQNPCILKTALNLAASKTFEAQHACQTTKTTTGLGAATSLASHEVYTQVEIQMEI